MFMSLTFWLTFVLCMLITGCSDFNDPRERDPYNPSAIDDQCENLNPDNISCKIINGFTNFIVDSFERNDVIVPNNNFGWRKIINDNGRVISGQSGNHVDAQIYPDSLMGPASNGNRALYHFGRQGGSVHNIYLITETFNLNELITEGDSVVIEFDYLPIGLESDEYLKLEVCNDSADNCGVGQTLTVAGLNSNKWETKFEVRGQGAGRNGRNHSSSDFLTQKIVLLLEDFQKGQFIFRFNARMDEGFKDNNHTQDMVDGIVIDNVRATAYNIDNNFRDEVENPDDLLNFDPTER